MMCSLLFNLGVSGAGLDSYLVIGEMEMIEAVIIPPTAPASLIASSKASNSATLSWTASADNVGVTGYDIYRNSTLVGSTNSVTLTTNVTGLSSGTTYNFSVKAKDAAGMFQKAAMFCL